MAKRRKSRKPVSAPQRRRAAPRASREPLKSQPKTKDDALLARELDEARQQQAATAEVLRIISTSPGDLEPVFHAILENATRICEAKFGTLILHGDGVYRDAALYGAPRAFVELRKRTLLFYTVPGSASRD